MSDNDSSNLKNKLNELREAQNSSETEHHVDTSAFVSASTCTGTRDASNLTSHGPDAAW